jgi:hypothetical protein
VADHPVYVSHYQYCAKTVTQSLALNGNLVGKRMRDGSCSSTGAPDDEAGAGGNFGKAGASVTGPKQRG